jgi:hypothetical protein
MVGQAASAAEAPGLVGEYFDQTTEYPAKLTGAKPVLVRIERQVNFGEVSGQFHKTKLSERFSARWSGVLKIDKAGTYEFLTESDDGSLLTIGDTAVVDNGGEHGMVKKSGTIELAAGTHPLVLQYYQGAGGAGCKLLWKPPGGKEAAVPKEALFHDPAKAKAISWDEAAWNKRKGGGGSGKFVAMDHGPFYTGTVLMNGGGEANKGIALRLDATRQVYACFDPETLALRFAAADCVMAHPQGRDGLEGQLGLEGEAILSVGAAGWAKPGSSDFADPRIKRKGNLPREWGAYRGLHLDGQSVILSYTIGKAGVLELPAYEEGAVTRSFTLSGNDAALALLVHEGTATLADGIAVSGDGEMTTAIGVIGGGSLAVAEGKVVMNVPAGTALAKVACWRGPTADLGKFSTALKAMAKPTDLTTRTKGGTPRWTTPVVTQGELGKGQTDDAYVVDTLTIPYENPWQCYMRTTAVDFFKDGRIAVATIDGDVWVVTPADADLSTLKWKRYASGMFQSLGLKIVDDVVYVTNRDRLIRLHDLNRDGEADFYENFNGDCEVAKHYHEFTLGLETDGDGNFIFNKGANLGEADTAHQGCVLKVSKDGSTLSVVATGLRAPNGLGGGDGMPLTNSDNEGNWVPASRVNLIKPGGFYGFMGTAHRTPKPTTYDPPICWLPRPLDNSSGGQVWVTSDKWGPLKGTLLHMSYGQSSLFVMPFEEIGGVPQGGVVRLPLSFQSSAMRARFSKLDGQLYLVGMRGWQTNAGKEGALHRIRYTGKPVTVPHKLSVTAKGVTITFPVALDPETAGDKDSYAVERWNYRYTNSYGSKDYKLSDPEQVGHDPATVTGVTLSPDRKSVTIAIADLKQVMQQSIKYKIATADGGTISGQLFHTINVVPQ